MMKKETFTLGDLKQVVDSILTTHPRATNFSLYIPNGGDNIGVTPATKIFSLTEGFGCDSERIFLIPENELRDTGIRTKIIRL